MTVDFLEEHQIDYVAHDAIPYTSAGQTDVYAEIKAMGKFLPTKRTDNISTSDIITRILHDYNDFIRRNLERGVSPKELNISVFKEGEIWMEKNVEKFLQELKKNTFLQELKKSSSQVKGKFTASNLVLYRELEELHRRIITSIKESKP